MKYILETKKLTKMYSKTSGIKNVNLQVKKGEFVSILGEVGSGKSTLLKLLSGNLQKQSGKIKFYTKDLYDNKLDILYILSYMPDRLLIRESIKFIDYIEYIKKYYYFFDSEYLERLCYDFKLDYNKLFSKMSLGELQIANIIIALFHKPEILILDEPTNYLDNESILVLKNYLYELKKDEKSIILSTNQVSLINDLTDKTYIIKDNILSEYNIEYEYKKITLKLDDVSKFKIDNILPDIKYNIVTFYYKDDISKLLKQLSCFNILDISIESVKNKYE